MCVHCIVGDGRMDSPGHCAKYCTYTVMNQSDKAILAMEVVDKRETGLKSVLMEAKGFSKAMESIRDEGVQLEEIVTDAHPQISSIMRKRIRNLMTYTTLQFMSTLYKDDHVY